MRSTQTALLTIALLAIGCTTTPINVAPAPPSETSFNINPKQMPDLIAKALANANPPTSIASNEHGVIITGYQEYTGDFHIARHWQEHTRYRISIIPDWDEPTAKCRLEVTNETEQRATGSQPWQADSSLVRPERSEAILGLIRRQVGQ